MYNSIFELISNLLYGALPEVTSFEHLFATGISGALCLGVVAVPFFFGAVVLRVALGRW